MYGIDLILVSARYAKQEAVESEDRLEERTLVLFTGTLGGFTLLCMSHDAEKSVTK